MHKHVLREISKFAAGLVAGDLLFGLWLSLSGSFPVQFLGSSWSASGIMAWTSFDVLLLLILIHYGWHAEIHIPSIKQKRFFYIVGTIIGVVALMHFVRLLFGASIDIAGWQAPYWMSWIATIVAAYISYTSFKFAAK